MTNPYDPVDRQDTLQAFAPGDVLVGCNWLNNPDDDHMGPGRILQFDSELNYKGVLWNKDTERFVVGLHFGPDNLLWAFDMHDHKVIHISPEGHQLPTHHFGDRTYGNINFKADGSFYMGEYFRGNKIHPATDCKKIPGTDLLGYGNIHYFSKDWQYIEEYDCDYCEELTGFKAVTHASLHPSEQFLTYTTETGKRIMRYDLLEKQQMPDLVRIEDGSIYDQNWFITPLYRRDGTLLVSRGRSIDIYDEAGKLLQQLTLGEYGYAQLALDASEQYLYACNVWTGEVTKLDLYNGEVVAHTEIDNSELALGWQRQQNDGTWKGPRAPRRTAAGIAVYCP